MRIILCLFGIGAAYVGLSVEVEARSVLHQLYGTLWLLIAAVLISSAAIVDAVKSAAKKQASASRS